MHHQPVLVANDGEPVALAKQAVARPLQVSARIDRLPWMRDAWIGLDRRHVNRSTIHPHIPNAPLQIIRLGTAEEDFSFHLEQENLDLVIDKVSDRRSDKRMGPPSFLYYSSASSIHTPHI